MNVKQLLMKVLTEWSQISKLDFCLLDQKGKLFLTTEETRKLPSASAIETFLSQDAVAKATATTHYYKIFQKDAVAYLLLVWGKGTQNHTIGELLVCQISSLLDTTQEKTDKSVFMQKLLLGSYTPVDIYNHAKHLHISTSAPRAVFIIETKQTEGEQALATLKNIFSARTGSFVTTLEEQHIVVIKEVNPSDTYETLEQTAYMLVDMLNTEVMTPAWVAYGNIAEEILQLPNAYKEAMTSLRVGKIFYPTCNTFGYKQLGIGHLIYQLPLDICQLFIDEIFKGETLDSVDDETWNIIKTFFENSLNLSETSRQLYLHRNTLVYRFEKLEKKFGLDIRTFEDAMTFKIAMMVVDYIKHKTS